MNMITKNEILNAFKFRHACKVFDKTKVIAKNDMEFILETARLSPSSFGFEPWYFVVVQNKELREKLKKGAWGATIKLDTASHFVLGLTMRDFFIKYDSPYIQYFMSQIQHLPEEAALNRRKIFKTFQKKDFDLNTERTLFDWASKQCYIAMANMMTAAAMIGIDSCPIEGFNKKTSEEVLQKYLDIDIKKYGLSYMLAFGYRLNPPKDKTRRQLNEIVGWKE